MVGRSRQHKVEKPDSSPGPPDGLTGLTRKGEGAGKVMKAFSASQRASDAPITLSAALGSCSQFCLLSASINASTYNSQASLISVVKGNLPSPSKSIARYTKTKSILYK